MDRSVRKLPWSRFVALGDSLTEGIGDPVRGSLRGWAELLARALRHADPELQFWNLARRSLTTKQVHETQLDAALALHPDLVSVVVGMNDAMSRSFDRHGFRRDLTDLVLPLAATQATVIMGTLPRDLPLLKLMPSRARASIRQRLRAIGEVAFEVADEHGALCIDAPPEWRYTMAECSIDGCHPNARGHAHIAELALVALADREQVALPPIDRADCGWLPSSMRHLRWLASRGYLQLPALAGRLRGSAPGPAPSD